MNDTPELRMLKQLRLTGRNELPRLTPGRRDLRRGLVCSVRISNPEGATTTRFALVLSVPHEAIQVVRMMLLSENISLAGRDDIVLEEHERPNHGVAVLSTSLLFPALKTDIGPVYSELTPETLQLLDSMNHMSGRDPSRMGTNRDDELGLRADMLRLDLRDIRISTQRAFEYVHSAEYDADLLVSLGVSTLTDRRRRIKESRRSLSVRPSRVAFAGASASGRVA